MGKTEAKKQAARARIDAAMKAVDPRQKVASLEAIIPYSFTDKSTAWEALQLPGNGFETPSMPNGNKRLAIVGDAVIDTILSEGWYGSGKDEATWTATRLATSSNESLAKVGRKLGLEVCIQNSVTNVEQISPYMMATAVEAIVGAVYLDSGKDLRVIRSLLGKMGILEVPIEAPHHESVDNFGVGN